MRLILLVSFLMLFHPHIYADDHVHTLNDPKINSDSDRLIAMFFESQCDEDGATLWYERSLAHFPENKLSQIYLRQMPELLKKESAKWAAIGRKYHNMNAYIFAIHCDITNMKAWEELNALNKERQQKMESTQK